MVGTEDESPGDRGAEPDGTRGRAAVTTGGEGLPARWWQILVGLLGWIVAAVLVGWFLTAPQRFRFGFRR